MIVKKLLPFGPDLTVLSPEKHFDYEWHKMAAGEVVDEHVEVTDEHVFVHHGHFSITVGDETFEGEAKDIMVIYIFIPAGTPHCWRSFSDTIHAVYKG